MFAIVGFVVVIVCVVGGYMLSHGNLHILFQPNEVLIICGAAAGAFLIGNPPKVVKAVAGSIGKIFSAKGYEKQDYMESLLLLDDIFIKIRKEGLISIESDVESPEKSKVFSKYPKVLANHHALAFITDTLRTVMTTTIASHELEALLDAEIEALHEEQMHPAHAIANVADGMPALGIVAAVLGVIITMGKIKEPPEVLGHHIGAALVGTFLGVLLSYGFVAPMGRNLGFIADEEKEYLNVFKVGIVTFANGAAPPIAIEFARRVIPEHHKPSFLETEQTIKQSRKK